MTSRGAETGTGRDQHGTKQPIPRFSPMCPIPRKVDAKVSTLKLKDRPDTRPIHETPWVDDKPNMAAPFPLGHHGLIAGFVETRVVCIIFRCMGQIVVVKNPQPKTDPVSKKRSPHPRP